MSIKVNKQRLRSRSVLQVSALAFAGMVGFTACAGQTDGGGDSGDGPVKIALMVSETGPIVQPAYLQAGELKEKQINEAGGVGGRDVEVNVYDIGGDPQTAINAANKAVGEGNVIAVGVAVTTLVNAVQPILERADVPLLYMANTASLTTDVSGFDNIFALTATTQAQQSAAVDFMKNNLGVKSVALTNTNDEGSQAAAGFAKSSVEEAGLEVQSDQAVAPTVTDLTPQVLNLKDADAILENGVPSVDTILIRNARQNGVDIPILLSIGGAGQVSNKLTPADQLDGVYINGVCAADIPLANQAGGPAEEYLSDFSAAYGADTPHSTLAGVVYDGLGIAADAVESVGSSDPAKLTEYFRDSVDSEGVCGTYKSNSETGVLASPDNAFVLSAAGGQLKRAE